MYGKENGETIKGNCGNIVYLISTEMQALEEISKMCGEVKSKEKEKTSSTPLVTVSDLQRMDKWETIIIRLRKMPFKTKLTPNYKMDWGHNFPKAEYPHRDRKEIAVFDLKSFVEKKREDKINNMLGGNSSPMGGSPFGGSPFGGGTGGLFGSGPAPTPFGGPNPFGGPKPSNNDNFNVDDLVKRIDAKIAELEEEERKEKEAQEKVESKDKIEEKIVDADIVSEDVRDEVKPNVTVQNNSNITDDQFFDDFFGDD